MGFLDLVKVFRFLYMFFFSIYILGGILAGILCSMRAETLDQISDEKPFYFRFAISVSSAFPPKTQIPRYSANVDEIRTKMLEMKGIGLPPTMHVYGTDDPMVDPSWSKEFAAIFPESTRKVYEHNGKHFIPVNSAAKMQFSAFVNQFR
jgi:hypothetical protein